MEIIEKILLVIGLALALGGTFLLIYSVKLRERIRKINGVEQGRKLDKIILFYIGLVFFVQLIIYVARAFFIGRIPLANLYDFSLALPLVIMPLGLYLWRKQGLENAFNYIMPLVAVLDIVCLALGVKHGEMNPILDSGWLPIHVISVIIAYGAFFVSFVMAIKGFLEKNPIKQGKIEESIYLLIRNFALPALTFGILIGSMWAEVSWGHYWSWDPKETWALVTWLYYALYLHLRLVKREDKPMFSKKQLLLFVIIGFFVVLFTFFGVSYLLPSLHSYK